MAAEIAQLKQKLSDVRHIISLGSPTLIIFKRFLKPTRRPSFAQLCRRRSRNFIRGFPRIVGSLLEPLTSVHSLSPCGHAFSAVGLRGVFQQSLIRAVAKMGPRHTFPQFLRSNAPIIGPAEVALFRAAPGTFQPILRCPICRAHVKTPPQECRNLTELSGMLGAIANTSAHGVNADADGDIGKSFTALFL